MKNSIVDLRNHLFEVIEALKSAEKPMDLERAEQVGRIADRIIDMAKVEVRHIMATGEDGSGFLPFGDKPALPSPENPARPRLLQGQR